MSASLSSYKRPDLVLSNQDPPPPKEAALQVDVQVFYKKNHVSHLANSQLSHLDVSLDRLESMLVW